MHKTLRRQTAWRISWALPNGPSIFRRLRLGFCARRLILEFVSLVNAFDRRQRQVETLRKTLQDLLLFSGQDAVGHERRECRVVGLNRFRRRTYALGFLKDDALRLRGRQSVALLAGCFDCALILTL